MGRRHGVASQRTREGPHPGTPRPARGGAARRQQTPAGDRARHGERQTEAPAVASVPFRARSGRRTTARAADRTPATDHAGPRERRCGLNRSVSTPRGHTSSPVRPRPRSTEHCARCLGRHQDRPAVRCTSSASIAPSSARAGRFLSRSAWRCRLPRSVWKRPDHRQLHPSRHPQGCQAEGTRRRQVHQVHVVGFDATRQLTPGGANTPSSRRRTGSGRQRAARAR